MSGAGWRVTGGMGVPRLPFSPKKIISLVSEVKDQSLVDGPVFLTGSDAAAVASVQRALVFGAEPYAASRRVETALLNGDREAMGAAASGAVAAIVVAARGELGTDWMAGGLARLDEKRVPVVLVLAEPPGIQVSLPMVGIGPRRVVGIASDGRTPADVLAEALVDAAGESAIALAAELPSLRRETCRQIIRRTARQNGVIGAAFFIPGTDMPVMTVNEARMVLRIAAAHGEEVGADRALELLGVVGAGLGLRTLARQALSLLPGPGWAIKAGVAYSGTQAVGRAAMEYFSRPARLTPATLAPLAERLRRLRG